MKTEGHLVDTQTPDLHAVIERLEKVEKENRRQKILLLVAVVFVPILVLSFGAISASFDSDWEPKVVEAHGFELLDVRGTSRAQLRCLDHNATLSFHDEKGNLEAALGFNDKGLSGLAFYTNGTPRVTLGALVDGTALLSFYNEKRKVRLALGLVDGEPGLVLFDDDGKPVRHFQRPGPRPERLQAPGSPGRRRPR